MMQRFPKNLMLLLLAFCLSSIACLKYKNIHPYNAPSYIRVFDDITPTLNVLNQNAAPYFTFIYDPVVGADKIPSGGGAVGDFLVTRFLYSNSFAATAGNTGRAIDSLPRAESSTKHFEYPGSYHVLTAPVLNGFDLSSWAQVPSGTHRIVFVKRPNSTVPFAALTATDRNQIVIDTMVNFMAGEVYTVEMVTIQPDIQKYALYVRQEQFVHQSFSADAQYISFYNLSGLNSIDSVFGQKGLKAFDVTYSTVAFNKPIELQQYQGYLTTVDKKFQTTAPYISLPLLKNSYFFDNKAALATPSFSFYLHGSDGTPDLTGLGPVPSFDSRGSRKLDCNQDPVLFNRQSPDGFTPDGVTTRTSQANINLVALNNGTYTVYPTVNIFEMVYDKVYMMQIQKAVGRNLN